MKNKQSAVMRQVQLVVGLMVLTGTLVAWLVTPWGLVLCGLAGAGLLQAAATGICPMELLIAKMPWNCAKA